MPNDLYAGQKKTLFDICSDTKILCEVNLIEIKYFIEGMKETILIIIKDLSDEDLSDLESLSQNEHKPFFLKNSLN